MGTGMWVCCQIHIIEMMLWKKECHVCAALNGSKYRNRIVCQFKLFLASQFDWKCLYLHHMHKSRSIQDHKEVSSCSIGRSDLHDYLIPATIPPL